MLKSKLTALLFAAVSLLGVGPATGADEAPIKTLEDLVQAATEGRATPAVWKEGWTWEIFNGTVEGCAKGAFSNIMKNARPQSWWPSGKVDPAKIPSSLLWVYGTTELPKLVRISFATCFCSMGLHARMTNYSEMAAFDQSPKATQVAEYCAKEAEAQVDATDKARL